MESYRENHQKRYLMRKKKGKGWIATALTLVTIGGAILANSSSSIVYSKTSPEVVYSTDYSTQFEKKKNLSQDQQLNDESEKAIEKITSKWTANSVEQVANEIKRQKSLGLKAYVIQWGIL